MEEKISFTSGRLSLEGMYTHLSGTCGAVITHPHPLYGGDLSNPVVESLVHSFNRKSISTLRFNFRGVRGSEGTHDGGLGEREDTLAAVHFLIEHGMDSIFIAGYSFGAWVVAHITDLPPEVTGLIFVAPPLAMFPIDESTRLPLLDLVITGEEDEIAPPELLRSAVPRWSPDARFEVVDYADHFYFGCFDKLEEIMHDFLSTRAG